MRRGAERATWGERLDAVLNRGTRAEGDERPHLRWNPGRGGAVAMGVVALVSVLVAVVWVLGSRPHRLEAQAGAVPSSTSVVIPGGSLASPLSRPTIAPSSSSTPGSAGSSAPVSVVIVDVVGKVARPGVYRLPTGSRVDDALRAAGGAKAGTDLTPVNLARVLLDGEQVAIGVPGATAAPAAVGSSASAGESAVSGPVDLNTATAEQLDALPGVGPVLAQHIIDWRTAHGRFDSVEQLNDVSGIGASKFSDLSSLVTVS